MSNTFQIKVDFDPLPQVRKLQAIRGELKALIEINRAAANGAANVLRDHWIARNLTVRRKPGWPASNYWAHAAESISTTATSWEGAIRVRHPGVHFYLKGGTITPKRARFLSPPLRPENKRV